jgi:hypothetical protein
MAKLGFLRDGEWAEHSHPPIFAAAVEDGDTRLVAGVPGGDPVVLASLSLCLSAPFLLLYVLHTPRGEGEPGRYQSPELSRSELDAFLADFAALLGGDARHDFWIHSPSDQGTLVWDRHNLIHAYGPLECFAQRLRALGFTESRPEIPAPHAHHYRGELDGLACALLDRFDWALSPLQPEDEQ